jgi:hypothetical protein
LAWVHVTHLPSHGFSQHTPSTQKPEAQTPALEQVTPFLVLQLPLPSHACPSAQLPGISVPAAAPVQLPSCPATAQDWQDPEHAAIEQQTPSTQKPDAQVDAVAAVHPSPLPRLVTLYSQVWIASPLLPLPPKSTTAPRWLSKAIAPLRTASIPEDRTRWYRVGPLVSNSKVLMSEPSGQATRICRRRRLS